MARVPGEQDLLPSRGSCTPAVGPGSVMRCDSGVQAVGQVRGAGSRLGSGSDGTRLIVHAAPSECLACRLPREELEVG